MNYDRLLLFIDLDEGIGIDSHDQLFTSFLRPVQKVEMPDMEHIKNPLGISDLKFFQRFPLLYHFPAHA